MKHFLDFLPLAMFFIFYKLYHIYYASGALIVASALVLAYTWLRYRKVKKIDLITFVVVVILNSLTLYYHNVEFLMWKITVIYALFSAVLLVNQFVFGKPLIHHMLPKKAQLPTRVLNNLNIAWSLFFLTCCAANIYVSFWLSQSAWVNFKVFGLTGLTLLATMISGIYIHRYIGGKQAK
ncbi:septation protein A [Candidatus Doolittlea endobia]|uniref:Inner membrane-spanning protein YciB n=1 Tax=Candidatus Doolittlea endobia TaxID=1778262 RepID=A0A143WT98_9ENTR|nr:septation protein A [Candidatus Doolittlea endobia]CUX96801.1 Intracellular septation protein [Candidatus Doolittlea endobia]